MRDYRHKSPERRAIDGKIMRRPHRFEKGGRQKYGHISHLKIQYSRRRLWMSSAMNHVRRKGRR